MAWVNRVLLLGNLTRDPEVRYLPSGSAVATLRLAVSRTYRTQGGEDREETCYVDVSVFGKQAEVMLDKVGITLNKNLVPYDPRPPAHASGVRIGTPAMTTRGMKEAEMEVIAGLIDQAVVGRDDPQALEKVRRAVAGLTRKFPIYTRKA